MCTIKKSYTEKLSSEQERNMIKGELDKYLIPEISNIVLDLASCECGDISCNGNWDCNTCGKNYNCKIIKCNICRKCNICNFRNYKLYNTLIEDTDICRYCNVLQKVSNNIAFNMNILLFEIEHRKYYRCGKYNIYTNQICTAFVDNPNDLCNNCY